MIEAIDHGDLGDARIVPTSEGDDVTLALCGELLWHGSILPTGALPALANSTRAAADPLLRLPSVAPRMTDSWVRPLLGGDSA